MLPDLKTSLEVVLVALAVSESGAARLGTADAATLQAPVDLRFVKTKHFPHSLLSISVKTKETRR